MHKDPTFQGLFQSRSWEWFSNLTLSLQNPPALSKLVSATEVLFGTFRTGAAAVVAPAVQALNVA